MTQKIEPLPYDYAALEPYIDEQTMKIHHNKHHQAYYDKFIAAIDKCDLCKEKKIEEILSSEVLSKISSEVKTIIINNGGGHYHHRLFWQILKKDVPFKGEVAEAIKKKWSGFEKFKEEFSNSAATLFGAGWTWLIVNKKKELEIIQTKNQDSPLSIGKKPILGIDLWEHAYYLKYQNKRVEYIENFFKVINWKAVNKLYEEACK